MIGRTEEQEGGKEEREKIPKHGDAEMFFYCPCSLTTWMLPIGWLPTLLSITLPIVRTIKELPVPLPKPSTLKMATARLAEMRNPQHLMQPNPESQNHTSLRTSVFRYL